MTETGTTKTRTGSEALYPNEWELGLYNRALDRWGVLAQTLLFIEECSEGIVKAVKVGREINGVSERDLVEELADISIMIEQMRLIYDQEGAFDGIRERKLRRLARYLHDSAPCAVCENPIDFPWSKECEFCGMEMHEHVTSTGYLHVCHICGNEVREDHA